MLNKHIARRHCERSAAISLLLIVFCAFFPTRLLSAETYTLPQLVDMAVNSRPEMDIASNRIAEAEGLIGTAKSYYYPQLNGEIGYTHLNEEPYIVVPRTTVDANLDLTGVKNDYPILASIPDSVNVPVTIPQTKAIIAGQDVFRASIDLNQPLFTGGKIKQRVNQAKDLKEIYRYQKGRSAEEIKYQVHALYFQMVFAERAMISVRAAAARLGVVSGFLENLYTKYIPKEGEKGVDRADYLKSRFVAGKIDTYRSEVQRLLDEAKKSLMLACGLDGTDFEVDGKAENYVSHASTLDPEGLKEVALNNRSEVKSVGLYNKIASAEVKRNKASYIPDVGIIGHARRQEDNFSGDQKNFAFIGVGAKIPIFNGLRTKGEIDKARAEERRAKSEADLLKLNIGFEVETIHNKIEDLRRKIDIGNAALQQARERRELESESYVLDANEYEDYLEALEDEVTADLALLKTKAEYYAALSELNLALGQ